RGALRDPHLDPQRALLSASRAGGARVDRGDPLRELARRLPRGVPARMRALALLAALACATPAGDDAGPAIGRFLIAKPQVGGFFAETVIVLVDHAETGSLGLIVNRALDVRLAELLPELEGARGHDERGFLGGPVATSQLLLLVRATSQPPGA